MRFPCLHPVLFGVAGLAAGLFSSPAAAQTTAARAWVSSPSTSSLTWPTAPIIPGDLDTRGKILAGPNGFRLSPTVGAGTTYGLR